MALYFFFPQTEHGSAPWLEAADLAGDDEAGDYAARLIPHHGSCRAIEIWDGSRLVRIHRDPEPAHFKV